MKLPLMTLLARPSLRTITMMPRSVGARSVTGDDVLKNLVVRRLTSQTDRRVR